MNWTPEEEKEARKIDNKLNRDSYVTPDYLVDYVNNLFRFDIDLAASDDNHKFDNYFTRRDDALSKDWHHHGTVGWCNPPYSNVVPWIEKAMVETRHGFKTVMLLPTPNGDSYNPLMLRHDITYIIGRVSFLHWKTRVKAESNNRGSCFVVFDSAKGLDKFPMMPQFVYRDDLIKGRLG